jgi:isoleucyl-tRNA synthetase
VYRFFITYANLEMQNAKCTMPASLKPLWRFEDARASLCTLHFALDGWLLARLHQLITTAHDRLAAYDARSFTQAVEVFLDDLSNWYVRRSRRRFWGTDRGVDSADREAAFGTLYVTLVTLARLLAPVLPFLSEVVYQNLVRSIDPEAPDSVHLTGYPAAGDLRPPGDTPDVMPEQEQLLKDMAVVRRAVELGRVARKSAGLRVRQPLARMVVAAGNAEAGAALLRHQNDVLDELNVKALEVLDSSAELLHYRVRPNLRLLGPRLGRELPLLRAALDGLDTAQAAAVARAVDGGQPVTLSLGKGVVTLAPDEVLVESAPLAGYAAAQGNGMQVALDTALTDALRREGLARDLVRVVQEARKAAGLALSDRITLHLSGGEALEAVLAAWGHYLRSETLATNLVVGTPPEAAHQETVALDGMHVTVGVVQA